MQFTFFLWPVLYALFLWWFTTGLIMVVYGCTRRVQRIYFALATVVMLAALGGLFLTRNETHPLAIYAAVTCGTVVWGWQMASYYLGFVTGYPLDRNRLPGRAEQERKPVALARRFRLALGASLHHELLVLVFVLGLSALIGPHANRWGLWMFLALWLMHSSAKLNVFFGVRNFRIEFLPPHMHGLGRLLSRRPINLFFAISVGVASSVVLMLIYHAFVLDTTPGQTVGALLLGTMILLGVIEQWLLVLPLSFALWGWSVRSLPSSHSSSQPDAPSVESAPAKSPLVKSVSVLPSRQANGSMRALPERVLVNTIHHVNES